MTEALWQVVLGGILAVSGGFLQQEYSLRRNQARQKKLLTHLLSQVIQEVNRIIRKLIETYDKTSIVYVLYLTELSNARVSYDRNSDWAVLFDDDLRRGVFDYFAREQVTRSYLHVLISLVGKPEFPPDHVKSETVKQIAIFRELAVQGDGLVDKVKRA